MTKSRKFTFRSTKYNIAKREHWRHVHLHAGDHNKDKKEDRSAVTPFRCLAAMPSKISTRAAILPGCPSLGMESREAEVGFEPRTFRKTAVTSAAEFAGSGFYTSLPSHCLTASGSFPPFTWLCEKNPSRKSVDWHAQHVAKPAQPMQCDQFIYRGTLHFAGVKRMPNREAELVRLFNILCITTASDPRRAMSSAYSISVSGRPGSASTPQAVEADNESSMIVSMTKLKRKGERGQPCLTPLDVVNSEESFPDNCRHAPFCRHLLFVPYSTSKLCQMGHQGFSAFFEEGWIETVRSWDLRAPSYALPAGMDFRASIMDSDLADIHITSVFNTNASLPYNHGLFESLIVKKRINMDGEGTYCSLTTIIPRCLQLQTLIQAIWIETDNKIATDIGWQPYLAASPTRRSGDHAVPILEGESRVGHLSAYATLNWAWKTALSSANDD
ncbi:hypothetical protein CSKR_103747 [Clonorchis sinensis]|uniref:Uncharacterized protein n=1 Tax=Clonorchis sinensis TaxID=79923 RepID=A0A3R7CK82_CLOSI|nr:hypothetical protein CSKR_103747 [Clonorchis sinensis]